jgi:hypothetical protein
MAIIVPIGVDTSGLTRGLSQGTSGLRKFGKMAAIVGGAAALGGLVATLKIGVDEFMQAQKVMAQTGAVLKSTGGAANVTAGRITSMSESLMKLSGIDDEAIQSGQNLLLTFTKIRNETGAGNKIFDQATLAMTNLSVAMGKDLSSSAILVGKALNDPVKGVGSLSRAGVQFTASQKDTIKALVDSGNVMGAQKLILKELETQFGGSAKAAGQTLPGQLNILKETFRNVAAGLVTTFIPYLSRAATALLDFVRQFAARPTFEGKVRFVIEKLRDAAGREFRNLYEWWTTSKTSVNTTGTITFTLAGREQFDKFFTGLEGRARQAGRDLVKALVSTLTSEGRKSVGTSLGDIFGKAFEVLKFTFRISGTTLATELITGIVEGLLPLPGRLNAFLSQSVIDAAKGMARKGKVFTAPFKIILTDPIKEAIASARASLSGIGSEIGGFLERVGAAGGKSKEASAIRARLKDEADAREKARLTEAVAMATTDADRATATRELNDYIDNQTADRLDAEVKATQDANQRKIDDLIQSFNNGTIGAQQFAADLNSIIGQDFGDSLGIAFVAGFKGALANLVTEIQGIAAGTAGVQAPAGSTVAGAQSDVAIAARDAENAKRQAAYDAKLSAWEKKRDARRNAAEEFRRGDNTPGGSKITPAEQAEITAIMKEWAAANAKPVKPTMLGAGGILKRQVFTAGEAGREAVIPLGSSEAMGIMRDALGGGGNNGATYVLNIQAGLGTNPDELGRVIVETIKKFEKRNGQVFAGPQIQATSAGVSTNGGTQSRNLRTG